MQGTTTAFMASKPPPFTEPEQNLQCPRCESTNTKFCYYNNYNLSQPRHFCKDCRRYWTKGGSLRNVPVGGGTRKNSKRSSSSSAAITGGGGGGGINSKRPSPSSSAGDGKSSELFSSSLPPIDNDHRMLDMTGSFSSLLSSTAQFGNFFECYNSLDSLPILRGVTRPMFEPEVQSSAESSGNDGAAAAAPPMMPENFLSLPGDTGSWAGGWPDLSIYTPGTNFQ